MNGIELKGRRILFVANTSWYLSNFVGHVIASVVDRGGEVYAISERDNFTEKLEAIGCKCTTTRFYSRGKNPIQDLMLTLKLRSLYRQIKPDCVLQFTMKPNIYGAIASIGMDFDLACTVSGIGSVLNFGPILRRLVTFLYSIAFNRSRTAIFLNEEDRTFFINRTIVNDGKAILIPGAGIDSDWFQPRIDNGIRRTNEDIVFLLFGRLLWEKGINEYLQAAKIVKARHSNLSFRILGFPVTNEKFGLTEKYLRRGLDRKVVDYLGWTGDVRDFLSDADCIVLPTRYGEGLPRSLLEAASMERPIIASDHVGCREVVEHGVNGFLFRTADTSDLVSKIEDMISLGAEGRREMGKKGRELVLNKFDANIVLVEYLSVIENLLR